MKTVATTLGLFFLSMFVLNNSVAQKANFTTPGGITIGIGAGYAYQKSDLANSKGFGVDFTIGSPLYHRENAFLGVDWKFRLLAGDNRAYDHRINPDYTYSNIRYRFFSYDLELGLTLNRLRERTGIVLTGFAGAGVTHGRTSTDLFDAGNDLYDFESIDPNRNSKLVYADLVTLSDGDFETDLVNKAAFLPTAGLFIGYQFSRSITLGIEYKTNFCLTEKNSFAGIDIDNRVISGSGIDRNNYVSLGFRWNLGGGASRRRAISGYAAGMTAGTSNTNLSSNLDASDSRSQPSVNITDPSSDAFHTESAYLTIRATINNVNGPGDISLTQNGFMNNSFTYNNQNQLFTANIRLREGENRIRIKASSQGSSAEDVVTITLVDPADAVNPAPTVEFSSPPGDRITTSSDRINVTASVKNIGNKEDIQLTLNGSEIPFEYYPVSGLVKAGVVLTNEYNNLFIRGSNGTGSAEDQLVINVSAIESIPSPTVRFIQPAAPVEVVENLFPMSAEIENVQGGNDIAYYRPVQHEPVQHAPVYYAPAQAPLVHYVPAQTPPVQYAPVYQQPVSQQPVYQQPVSQQPVSLEPISREPAEREPVTRQPVAREPVAREPVAREPIARQTVTRERVSREGVSREGVSREGVSREGVSRERLIRGRGNLVPVSDEPVNPNPGTNSPVTSNPGTTNPVTSNPGTTNPVTSTPVTSNPVTSNPVSSNPVTSNPVTSNPVTVEEEESAIRINPGNDAWQFCLKTPSGTFSREHLTNANFSYSGQASSLYFMPIGGGGAARVNGKSFTLKSGQYYLFTGNVQVSVSTRHPGAMGQWSVRISADRQPVTGNGNNRPESPCETDQANPSKGNKNRR